MKLILHGIFARDYGPSVDIEASSVAEALTAFSRQVGFYADRLIADRPVARVIGYDTEEALRAPSTVEEVHVVPAMFGGGGKFGQILIGLALIAIAFIPGIGPMLHVALIVAGITTILGGVLNLFVKSPSATPGQANPEASLYLAAAGMTTAIGTPIGLCVGRVKRAGQALSFNVTASSLTQTSFPGT